MADESGVFNLEAFERGMAALTRLSEESERVMDQLIADLGLGPSMAAIQQEAAEQQRQKHQTRADRRSQRRKRAPAQQETQDMVATRTVSDAARKILSKCVIDDDAIQLPRGEDGGKNLLDRKLYLELNSVLEALGGKWTKRREAHVFTDTTGAELADRFYTVVETGTFERPQDYGYYPTPDWLVDKMIHAADIAVNHRVLEPSAGRGAILLKIQKKVFNGAQLAICELLEENRHVLTAMGFKVDAVDFMTFDVGPMLDRVVMNPPFQRSQAPLHVKHAIRQLKPGGRLVSIMPTSIMQRQDRLHREVRAELMRHGTIHPLPDDAFRESGTMVRTVLVTYNKPLAAADQPFQEPQDAPQTAQEGRNVPEATVAPPRRFARLSETPRRTFARPKLRTLNRTKP